VPGWPVPGWPVPGWPVPGCPGGSSADSPGAPHEELSDIFLLG
jgi:hypothetical protein